MSARLDTAVTLGHASANTSRPDRANEESAKSLLKILLAKREAGFRGRGKYHPPTEPDLEGLPDPPSGWIWASPEQLASAAPYALGIGPFGSNLKVSDYRETGTPLIFVRNIRAEDFSLVAKFVADEKANELAAHTADAYSDASRTPIPILVGQQNGKCRTGFRFRPDRVPEASGQGSDQRRTVVRFRSDISPEAFGQFFGHPGWGV